MLHPQTQEQFEALLDRHPKATLTSLPSGAALIRIPDFKIADGWTAAQTEVRFIVPVGYPGPPPDCFWATSGLRLAGDVMPQASQDPNQIPESADAGLWFSWHVTDPANGWDPNRDTLLTYVEIIAERFRRRQ